MSRIGYNAIRLSEHSDYNLLCKVGETYTDDRRWMAFQGIAFYWKLPYCCDNYFYLVNPDDVIIREIEILGEVRDDVGRTVNDTSGPWICYTNKMKVLKILNKNEIMKLCNEGTGNIGYFNKGNNNRGNYNKGNNNNGKQNEGNNNNGSWNIGDDNVGDCNDGNNNKGNWNKGNNCTGSHNIGNNIVGFFNDFSNKGSLDNIALFNKLSGISMEEFKQMEVYEIANQSRQYGSCWAWLLDSEKRLLTQIPNFNKKLFCMITSIPEGKPKLESDDIEDDYINDIENYDDDIYDMSDDEQESEQSDEIEYRDDKIDELKLNVMELASKLPNFNKDIFKEITRIKINKK